MWETSVTRHTSPTWSSTAPSACSPSKREKNPKGPSSTPSGAARPPAAMSQARIALRAPNPTCIPSRGDPSVCACMVPESCPRTAPKALTRVAASNPARWPMAAAAPNVPAVAGRKKRRGLLDATPRWQATSTPRARAVRKSRPPMPPSRSAHARAAATGTVKVWTTAPSCTQSNSPLWIWYALQTAAPAAESRAPCDQTRAWPPGEERRWVSTSSLVQGPALPPAPTPRVSRRKVRVAAAADSGRSS